MTPDLQSQSSTTAFQMKSGLYTLTTLELHVSTLSLIKKQLQMMIQKAPKFFQQTPVIIALEKLKTEPYLFNLSSFKHLLHEFGMILVAVKGGSDNIRKEAAIQGIAWLPEGKNRGKVTFKEDDSQTANVVKIKKCRDLSSPINKGASEPTLSNIEKTAVDRVTRIVERPVRSGQQVYSSGDLVILGSVSAGAELVAEGHIHIYGPLRGRALAGVNGQNNARIFCRQFEAELISVCGQYKLPINSDKSLWGQSVLISLKEHCLHMTAL